MQENGGHQSSGKAAKGQAKGKGRTNMRKNQPLYMNLSSEVLWSDIQEFAKLKYQVPKYHFVFLSYLKFSADE